MHILLKLIFVSFAFLRDVLFFKIIPLINSFNHFSFLIFFLFFIFFPSFFSSIISIYDRRGLEFMCWYILYSILLFTPFFFSDVLFDLIFFCILTNLSYSFSYLLIFLFNYFYIILLFFFIVSQIILILSLNAPQKKKLFLFIFIKNLHYFFSVEMRYDFAAFRYSIFSLEPFFVLADTVDLDTKLKSFFKYFNFYKFYYLAGYKFTRPYKFTNSYFFWIFGTFFLIIPYWIFFSLLLFIGSLLFKYFFLFIIVFYKSFCTYMDNYDSLFNINDIPSWRQHFESLIYFYRSFICPFYWIALRINCISVSIIMLGHFIRHLYLGFKFLFRFFFDELPYILNFWYYILYVDFLWAPFSEWIGVFRLAFDLTLKPTLLEIRDFYINFYNDFLYFSNLIFEEVIKPRLTHWAFLYKAYVKKGPFILKERGLHYYRIFVRDWKYLFVYIKKHLNDLFIKFIKLSKWLISFLVRHSLQLVIKFCLFLRWVYLFRHIFWSNPKLALKKIKFFFRKMFKLFYYYTMNFCYKIIWLFKRYIWFRFHVFWWELCNLWEMLKLEMVVTNIKLEYLFFVLFQVRFTNLFFRLCYLLFYLLLFLILLDCYHHFFYFYIWIL